MEGRLLESKVEKSLQLYGAKLRKLKNVIGYSEKPQRKMVKGKETNIFCIRFYVKEKLPDAKLKKEDIIPGTLEGLPTDIIPIGELVALSIDKKMKHRPMPHGVSIGHKDITAGTAGALAIDKESGKKCTLSNNHVLANENKAKIGDEILQQGPLDGGRIPGNVIETLTRFVPLYFEKYTCPYRRTAVDLMRFLRILQLQVNDVDAAIATPLKEDDILAEIVGIGKPKGVKTAEIGMKCQKSGRTTCHTTGGKVIDTNFTGRVSYSRGDALFRDQILIEKEGFSAGGDSGSLILDLDKYAIALLFAGSETHTIGNPISKVQTLLNIELVV